MRMHWFHALALSLVFLYVSASGQQPPGNQPNTAGNTQAAPAQPPAQVMSPEQQKQLDGILNSWETDAKALNSLYLRFKADEEDVIFKQKTQMVGEAKILKMPNGSYGLRLEMYEMDRNGKPDPTKLRRKYVCSGLWFYDYDPANKIITSRQVENKNLRPDDGPFAFIFGMKAVDAKKRFSMTISQSDQHYTWIKVLALMPQDQRDFSVAQVGVVNYANRISPKDFPLRIMWREPNNNVRSWEFFEVIRNDNTKVNPLDFSIEEDKRNGWKVQTVPSPGALSNQIPPNGVVPAGGSVPRK